MRGKQRLGMNLAAHVFDDSARDAHAVKGARPPADLIQNHEAVLRRVLQDLRHLIHLDHEGALPADKVIARPDAREDAVDGRKCHLLRRHEAAALRHERQKGDLAHVGRLSRHIRPCDEHDLAFLMV